MPAFATINLKNQAATETAFTPADINPSTKVARFLGAGASYDAKPIVTVSTTLPSGSSTKVRIRGKISLPIMDPVDSTRKIDEVIGTFEFSFPRSSALADRQNCRAFLADLAVDPVIVAAVENYESVY